ncbi:MAG: FG-GAP repeat protein, partial [Phycisphaerales bacterium]|nr:FG-GAP repeat protein [Phycisphaerales bacterium]
LASATDLLVGAPGWVPGLVTQFKVGAAYAFRFAGGFWAQNEVIPSPNSPSTSDGFGRCVAAAPISGGMRVLIGAPRESDSLQSARRLLGGAAYAFDVPASGFSQTQKLVEPLGLGHQAGFAVAVSGDWAVVGVPYAEPPVVPFNQMVSQSSARGEALVYRRVNGEWTFHSTLVAQTASTDSRFGQAVAIDGTTIAIGAPEYDHTDIDTFFYDKAGAVFVFTLNGSVWTEQQQILHPSAAPGDLFGYAVAVKGDLLLVGAPTDNTAAGTDAGSAYTFTRTAGVWGDPHVVAPPDAAANDLFGNSVGIIGSVGITFGRYIVVSAYLDDDLGADSGSATLFRETLISGGGGGGGFFWDSVRKFVAADGQAGDQFGAALAVGGSVIVFGARLEDAAGTSAGAAYIFRNTALVGNPNWGTGSKVTGSGVAANDRFGASVATDGSTVVVGAPLDDNLGGSNAGAAFIFRSVGGVWTEQQKIGAADRAAEDQFGSAIAVSGSTILVGAPLDDNAEGNDSGAAYFFDYALTVPTIATQPASGAACRGDKTFTVVAAGGGPYTYPWKRNTVNLANGPKNA